MELIGKQIAIETILGQPPELHYPSWYAAQIEKLPPAPPEYLAEQAGILVTDSDTISRAKAIEELLRLTNCKTVRELFEYNATHNLAEMWSGGINDAIDAIIAVPPAQPEIIYCKDCRKHNKKLGFDENYNLTYKDDACPLIPWRGMSKGHEHDYQSCCFGERRDDE